MTEDRRQEPYCNIFERVCDKRFERIEQKIEEHYKELLKRLFDNGLVTQTKLNTNFRQNANRILFLMAGALLVQTAALLFKAFAQ